MQNNKNTFISIVIILLVIVGGYFLMSKKVDNVNDTMLPTTSTPSTTTNTPVSTNPTPAPTSKSQSFENEFIKLDIPAGWTVKEAMKKDAETKLMVKTSAVNITKGKYILYISPNASQASGVEGGRFAEISMGSPSADTVNTTPPSPACGNRETLSPVMTDRARVDLYMSSGDKQDWCKAPTNGKDVWYFSYVTDSTKNTFFNYYQAKEGENVKSLVVTMSYNSKDINTFPLKGSPELTNMLGEMTDIVNTITLKKNSF